MALLVCAACGKTTGEGVFCEKCGAELSMMTSSGGKASSAFFHIEHDQGRVFMVGQTMNFRFALTPLVDALSNVFVAVVFEGCGRKVEIKQLNWIPCKGERRELRNINFSAPEAGSLGFSFYFGFRHEGMEHVLEADGEYKVWPSFSRAQDVIRNLEINIQNSGHAADFDLSGIREQLRPDERLEEIIDKLHRMPPRWSALRLYGSNWRPPRIDRMAPGILAPVELKGCPPVSVQADRLTLRTGDQCVHLLSGDRIRLGKNRQNDVVTRLFENGQSSSSINSKISRYHCTIEREGEKCFVVDRGDYPEDGARPSAYGVFLDGRRIPANGRSEIKANKQFRLTLAGADSALQGVLGFDLETWSCPSGMRRICGRSCKARQTGSVVLRRHDSIPETYLLLWECFSMGVLDPLLEGIVVWRQQDGYGYATADQEGWLEPGMVIHTPKCDVCVEEWKQVGL